MIYVLFNKGLPVHVTTESPYTGTPALKEFPGVTYDEAKDSWDYKSFEEVEGLAKYLTAMTGEQYLPFDQGSSRPPRYGVFVPPKVGDDVSYGFNGDYYPCGRVTRITKGWRIYTEDPNKAEGAPRQKLTFNRRKNTSGWTMVGGTWGLVKGIVDERNPHF